jgi:hypothetical protein
MSFTMQMSAVITSQNEQEPHLEMSAPDVVKLVELTRQNKIGMYIHKQTNKLRGP